MGITVQELPSVSSLYGSLYGVNSAIANPGDAVTLLELPFFQPQIANNGQIAITGRMNMTGPAGVGRGQFNFSVSGGTPLFYSYFVADNQLSGAQFGEFKAIYQQTSDATFATQITCAGSGFFTTSSAIGSYDMRYSSILNGTIKRTARASTLRIRAVAGFDPATAASFAQIFDIQILGIKGSAMAFVD